MNSAYDADRIFGILVRVRAGLGFVAGALLLLVMVALGASQTAKSTVSPRTAVMLDGRPTPQDVQEFMRLENQTRQTVAPDPKGAAQGLLLLGTMAIFGLSAFELALGGWIGAGERRGFAWGAGTEGVSCLLGLFNMTRNPVAGVGFLLSLVTFVYCLARLNGTGPKPV